MRSRESPSTDLRAPRVTSGAASLALMITSLFVLDGCAVIKGIFKAGFGVGVLVVVAIVAIIGGIVAVVARKK